MDDEPVLSEIFLPSKGLPMQNNKLKPIPRLIGRILAYNLLPKTSSFDYFSHYLIVCVYAVMVGLKVN